MSTGRAWGEDEGTQAIRAALLAGAPAAAGMEIIDAHAHIGPWFNFRIPQPYANGMLRTMDQCGIAEAWITADAAIGPDFRLGNDLVWQAVRDHPDRFRGYVTVNPHQTEPSAEEVRRRVDQGWRMIKLHPGTHQHPADGPGYRPIWELAQQHRLHVLSHSFPSAQALAALAATYREVSILVAHAASAPERLAAYYEVCAAHPNVSLDLCGSLLWRGMLEQMVAGAGAGRILYGSDIPFIDPRPQLGRVAFARLPRDALRAVLGGNARAIWRRLSRGDAIERQPADT
ncbi:MAG: amidohydrolase family protein [Chloroflexota bacterium]